MPGEQPSDESSQVVPLAVAELILPRFSALRIANSITSRFAAQAV